MSVRPDHFFVSSASNYANSAHFDVIVVGGGLAALSLILQLPSNVRIALVNKSDWQSSSSFLAQGGIAAVMDPEDSISAHLEDTCIAGAGLCHSQHSNTILQQASEAINWLVQMGVPFSEVNGQLHLTREGGHRTRRIVHAADATGEAVMRCLWAHATQATNITFFNGYHAIDLLKNDSPNRSTCTGLIATQSESTKLTTLLAPHIILATGGSGQLFPRTSNPSGATADGQAMAWRAGCSLSNLEFIQFHPTGLSTEHVDNNAQCPLVSEALRGEGAWLRLPNGQRFMPTYDERAELAPRDIVARAIYQEMQLHQLDHMLLDIRHRGPDFIEELFPNVLRLCRKAGIDPVNEAIPVAPLAHYACGGIVTNIHGQTDLPGLYAIGECAYTGLHGANRLASNSLLEAIVMAKAASNAILNEHKRKHSSSPKTELSQQPVKFTSTDFIPSSTLIDDLSNYDKLRQTLQQVMWRGAGIVRTKERMQASYQQIKAMRFDFQKTGIPKVLTAEWLELRNLLDMAILTLDAALKRPESCGAHYVEDLSESVERAAT